MVDTNFLLELVSIANDRVEKFSKEYYYQAGDYKIDNGYLASWYEQHFGVFVPFVSPKNVSLIRKELNNKEIAENDVYTVQWLKNIRKKTNHLQLLFSGGVDSAWVLKLCIDNNIYLDEVVSVVTGDSVDLPENSEIKNSACKYAVKYNQHIGKFTLSYNSREFLREFYSDPFALIAQPEIGCQLPFLRQSFRHLPAIDGIRLIGPDKPQLINYQNKWFLACYDAQSQGELIIPEIVKIGMQPESIKSSIVDARQYRDYLLQKGKTSNNGVNFYLPSDNDCPSTYRRFPLEFDSKRLDKLIGKSWSQKDIHALQNIISNQDLDLFLKYSQAYNTLMDIFPNNLAHNGIIAHGKFCWAIDIDSLEVYTQQQLVPDGF